MSRIKNVRLPECWKEVLKAEFDKKYFILLKEKLLAEKQAGKIIYPRGNMIFNAFERTPFENVKVVILGQDPYHNPGEAMGLSFSVPSGVRTPPSLNNIYKELANDIEGFAIPSHGDLRAWSEQGVFLLNAILTVEHRKAGSHRNIGWQHFTDAVIMALSEHREQLVFMLWGNFAKAKSDLINPGKHLILKAAHPSPLARGAYFGSKHFSQANTYLEQHGIESIDWKLS